MHGAVASALAGALRGEAQAHAVQAAGHAIADAVAAHAATFAPGGEPAYHDQYHQAEATVAMGWLCATAHRLGLLTGTEAAAGVLAMAGHDLLHDGSVPQAGVLEARSADLTVALAGHAGVDAPALSAIRRVILATDPVRPPAARAADDLLCRLGQEADLFGSITPGLGWRLGQALAREWRAAGHPSNPPLGTYASRLGWLRWLRPATPAGRALGLDTTVADQIAALAAIGGGDAAGGVARLDALPQAQARAEYLAALSTVAPA